MAKKRKYIVIRRARVMRREAKRLTFKKALIWLKNSFKQHPIISGIMFFFWISYFLRQVAAFLKGASATRWTFGQFLSFHLAIIVSWFILVVVSNLLKDTQPTKWYYKKRFLAALLVIPFFTPFGIAFMWLGSRFKTSTKIIFTVIFGMIFLVIDVYGPFKYEEFIKKSAIERIVDLIASPKEKVFLKKAKTDTLSNIQLRRLAPKKKVRLDPIAISSQCSASVVSIKTKNKSGEDLGLGSGFIISQDGLILTNFHVLQGAYSAEVKFKDVVFDECMLIRGISQLDIALIKVEALGLPPLAIGDSDKLESGQEIVAIGNPWGLEHSISDGLVSAVREKGDMEIIQITAPVSPGSSGGPIINSYGEVVGITTIASLLGAQNLNFAIPINYLKRLIGAEK